MRTCCLANPRTSIAPLNEPGVEGNFQVVKILEWYINSNPVRKRTPDSVNLKLALGGLRAFLGRSLHVWLVTYIDSKHSSNNGDGPEIWAFGLRALRQQSWRSVEAVGYITMRTDSLRCMFSRWLLRFCPPILRFCPRAILIHTSVVKLHQIRWRGAAPPSPTNISRGTPLMSGGVPD